jgi:uncharacterized protein (DUF488 family)
MIESGGARMTAATKFYTIGYGGRLPQEFAELLVERGIRSIADVRLRPDRASMGSYVRARTPEKGIEKLLADHGIAYHSIIELGNVFLECTDWRLPYQELMRHSGELLVARLFEIPAPFCLLCAEKRVADCHRRMIAEHLVDSRGWQVEHIE